MGKLFGTDGIRGIANKELTAELAFKIGRAGAYVLSKENKHSPTIIVGMDTRISGDMLEAALTAGMCSVGAKVIQVGVIPTPAIAFLVRHYNLDAGVVISASHNPVQDNGIKFFNNEGYKLKDELELEIEDIIFNGLDSLPNPIGLDVGYRLEKEDALNDYIKLLKNSFGELNLKGLKIVIDCANGATYETAPIVMHDLKATVYAINSSPDGTNINANCGSTHMESLIDAVKSYNADIGIAYDGDGDRCLLVDELGNIVDGDQILSICGTHMKENGELKNNTIVGTVMSNLGFIQMGKKLDINILQASVGDRYVLEEMLENDYNLGGEQSGHIIFLDYNSTGDGILTSLQILKQMKITGKKLSELNTKMNVLPQVLVNAKIRNDKKYTYLENEVIALALEQLQQKFELDGRVLIRPSGTEALVRVMIEGTDVSVLQEEAEKFAALLELHLS